MNKDTLNPTPAQPQSYKVTTPYGPVRIVIDADGYRWAPVAPMAEYIGLRMGAILAKLDNRYWETKHLDIPQAPWKLCLPAKRVTEFLRTIKERQIPSEKWPCFRWFQNHAFITIHGFQVPAPVVPLITEEEPRVIRTPRAKVEEAPKPEVVSSALIPIRTAMIGGGEINAVSGRDLHEFLEVGKVFAAWMPDQIEAFGFQEHQDFEVADGLSLPNSESSKSRAQKTKEYMISISMAKELAMVQRTAKGKQARLYFIECERRALAPVAAMTQFRVPTNLREALHLAAELEDKRMELECKVEAQQETISVLEPKAAGLDLIATTSEGAHTLTESAKILQQPPRKFAKHLEREGWVYRTNGHLTAYQPKIHQGLMEHKFCTVQHGDGPVLNVAQPLITAKGLAKLAQMLGGVS